MNSSKISIIIPVYRVERYLPQCLDSVLGQTLSDIEIICINDGSPDRCGDILAEYSARDDRITVITTENKGQGNARNVGITKATGEYLAFLDSDDWVAPDFYRQLYFLAEKFDADMAAGDAIYYTSEDKQEGGWVSDWTYKSGKTIIETPQDKKGIIYSCAVWNKIFRRKFILENKLEFPVPGKIEDFPFNFSATALANKIVINAGGAVYYYRQRDHGDMHSARNNRTAFDVMGHHYGIFKSVKNMNISDENKGAFIKISETFFIENLYSWIDNLPECHRQEFFEEYKRGIEGITLGGNNFSDEKTRWIAKLVRGCGSYVEFRKKRDAKGAVRRKFGRFWIKIKSAMRNVCLFLC